MRLPALAALLTLAAAAASAQDRPYQLGGGGWRVERYGSDIAILRSIVLRPGGGTSGSLLVSCEGRERRLRLTLPERLAALDDVTEGRLLARPLPATPSGPVILARVAIEGGRLMSLSDAGPPPREAVRRLTRLLRARPPGLEWLISPGPGPIAPARLVPLVLDLIVGPGDGVVLDDFSVACGTERP